LFFLHYSVFNKQYRIQKIHDFQIVKFTGHAYQVQGGNQLIIRFSNVSIIYYGIENSEIAPVITINIIYDTKSLFFVFYSHQHV